MRPRRHRTPRDQEAVLRSASQLGVAESLAAVPGKRAGLIGTAEKLLFNIGRIPVRQSRPAAFARPQTANLAARAEKGSPQAAPWFTRPRTQAIEIYRYFIESGLARSLLILKPDSSREAARVQRHARSSNQRVFSDRAAEAARHASSSSQGNDIFAALVDNSTAANTGNDNAAAQAQSSWQRGSDAASAAAAAAPDNARRRQLGRPTSPPTTPQR